MNYRELLEEFKRYHLCTYFILPLVGLTRNSFGGAFINSFLTRDGTIVVKVSQLSLVSHQCKGVAHHSWHDVHGGYLQYHIDWIWHPDFIHFCDGEYSLMSTEAKNIINERSGLIYQEETSGGLATDLRLRALQGEEAVRVYWERELGVDLDPHQELLSKPPVESFITVKKVS